MGANLSCACDRSDVIEQTKQSMPDDILEMVMIGKLPPQNILYEFQFEKTKIYIIKSSQIEEFCNNRSLFKYSASNSVKLREVSSTYFDLFYLTNFSAKKELAMVILQFSGSCSDFGEKIKNIFFKNPKVSRFNLVAGVYKVEDYLFTYEQLLKIESLVENLQKTLNNKTLKNFMFLSILSTDESMFKIIYQRNMNEDFDFSYHIQITEGLLEEESIKCILYENKNKLLKAILVLKINKFNRKYLFVFEQNMKAEIEYDSLVISMEKKNLIQNSSNIGNTENYLKEAVLKLNDLQIEYKLSTIVSDERKMIFVLTTEISNSNNEEKYLLGL